ncbi:MAG TPA: DNA polymerase/3'-5' exonuclease PolX [Blastocatellia bacterium]|nr:DNA polymerase/3'-5' exonuclease PolX [Blastocatellia bacterium]
MNKFEVAATLKEIAALMRIKGEDQFRWRAYARAAQSVAEVSGDFGEIVEEKKLTQIKGIGGSLAGLIEDLYKTGRSSLLERLREELPEGVLTLSKIPGLNVKKIQALNRELGISSISDLKAALEAGKLRNVPGFGAKSEISLREKIAGYETRDERILLLHALRTADSILEYMRSAANLRRVDLAGSARRWKETVSNIKLTGSVASDPENAVNHFLSFPPITNIEKHEKTTATVKLMEGIRVSFSAVTSNEYWNLLHSETGSKSHVSRVRELAREKGFEITPTKMKVAGKRTPLRITSETDIYKHLEMQYIPPELREDEGEIEDALAGRIPDDLVLIDDIKGMVHCHTTFSDGRNTVEEMALAAQAMGIKYMTITDHSPTAHYARGLEIDRLKLQWDEISRVQEKVSIKLLRGTESDILRDGALDYPDSILEKFDVIIASIHNRYKLDEDEMTRRVINAMKNPMFKIWGHPLGRLVQRRPPIACRLEKILDVIAESAAAIEISGDPHRLDLEPKWIKEARKRSLKFVISTDAHSTADLENLRFGIGIARRGGVRRGEVLNTLSFKSFQQSVNPTV